MRTLAAWAFGISILIGVAAYSGWLVPLGQSVMATLVGVAALGLVGGGGVLGVAWAYDRYRERFPTAARREAVAADAMALGLRSLERDTSTLDPGFRFLRPRGRASLLTQRLDRTFSAFWATRFDWLFAGTWGGTDVSVFDYTDSKNGSSHEWTCATLRLERTYPSMSIIRRNPVTGRLGRIFDRGFRTGDEPFDRAFHVEAGDPSGGLDLLSASTRERLLASVPPMVVVETREDRLLVCGFRLPTGERRLILDTATAVRDAFGTANH